MLTSSRDTTLYESAQGVLGNGAGEYFFAGQTKDGEVRRGLVVFGLAGAIPEDATIVSVALTLTMTKSMSGDRPVSIHRVLRDWGEGASNAVGEEGQGAPTAPGDATWIHSFYDSDFWDAPGGDFAEDPSAVRLVGDKGTYTWESTAQMVADAQSWLAGADQNFGWIIVGKESETFTTKRFNSRENADEATRPLLTVEFQPAPCPADCDHSTGAGVLDLFDFLCFQNAFAGADPAADCTGDGVLDLLDFQCFAGVFDAGCP